MVFQDDYQYELEKMNPDSFIIELFLIPLIVLLVIILVYSYIKKKILKDDKEDLESLKILQELFDAGTISEIEFQNKKRKITSKW